MRGQDTLERLSGYEVVHIPEPQRGRGLELEPVGALKAHIFAHSAESTAASKPFEAAQRQTVRFL